MPNRWLEIRITARVQRLALRPRSGRGATCKILPLRQFEETGFRKSLESGSTQPANFAVTYPDPAMTFRN